MTAVLVVAALLAALQVAEWLTRPPSTGRHHAPQTVHKPRRHHRGERETPTHPPTAQNGASA